MTSRERFLKVLNGEMPDQVPVTTFILDQGHFISQLYPDVDPEDFETLQLKIAEVQRQFGMDVCVRLLFGLNDPLFIHMGGVNTSVQTDTWEVDTEVITKEKVTIYRSTIRTPDGTITQDFSKNEVRPGTFLYACTDRKSTRLNSSHYS